MTDSRAGAAGAGQYGDTTMTTARCMRTKFPLGRLVITTPAREALSNDAVLSALGRHAGGDWGDLCEEDREMNERALLHGDRLFSVYRHRETRFYVITEWDRSATTILLPEDY